MIEGNANPFSAAPPIAAAPPGLAPVLESTKANTTESVPALIILSGA